MISRIDLGLGIPCPKIDRGRREEEEGRWSPTQTHRSIVCDRTQCELCQDSLAQSLLRGDACANDITQAHFDLELEIPCPEINRGRREEEREQDQGSMNTDVGNAGFECPLSTHPVGREAGPPPHNNRSCAQLRGGGPPRRGRDRPPR